MAFTVPTLTQAQAALASRLNDSAFVRWTASELTLYIQESLRFFNSVMALYRNQGTMATVQNQPFYDLSTALSGSLRAYTVTNWNLVTQIQYALLEPPAAGGTWTGTDQFTLQQVSDAIQRRRDQFLLETGMVLTRTTPGTVMTADGRYGLAENILTVRRALFRPNSTQLLQPLQRSDEWGMNHYATSWPTSTTPPSKYSTSVTPPITIQIVAPPSENGTLDLIAVQSGAAVVSGVSATLGMPDDWTWVVKYGVLADLLQQDGLARDLQRAQYCLQRWDQGVTAAQASGVVLAARIGGQVIPVNDLFAADKYWPLWQLVNGTPTRLLTAGLNLVAVAPPPGGSLPTVTLDVVQNAPVPVIASDVLQITADMYDPLLDYAEHLALWKEGPSIMTDSMPLLQNAMRYAGVTLSLQQAAQPSRQPLMSQSATESGTTPRSEPVSA